MIETYHDKNRKIVWVCIVMHAKEQRESPLFAL
ncbi:lipid A biosynthesis lauroyl acyltransferase [Vibrio alginolyticus]|uniref:Lipid A biosynthesis lauroyl acyltransferase n=1 Tax=Vibrio alginolyticus TaxID=663 RepID=A0A0H0YCY7_VIBAL|nr:lipid A biosynthesis lauroyl acyltransferase [Vibrio alginolyticus]EAS74135.1 lipid A biosynthesis lauroyl acyltransferase [Vibrio alginolyticus 12G01]KFJ88687.1 lipid A biosynthesis lauroyl acyltransferase [Vibrio sp. OY15]NNN41538.1 lipid A biosynthesis lauroyl acyltransferase [Vibrio sp. 2-2(2)]NNN53457.1 lipid A biosynthesis lauroyl acyltransferase [Vibrio sp. 2-2(7)]NNN65118.1 lipid A biosynthesis lauroyl acyltransferase [Vibrio sp. 2-1(7)]NNN88267.1 lipid A biosynthesis lauroyl acylt